MLTNLIEQIERTVLHMKPHRSVRFLEFIAAVGDRRDAAGPLRRTVRLAAERSSFYREQFRKRGIDVRRVRTSIRTGGLLHNR